MDILLVFSGFIIVFVIVLYYECKIRHFRQRNNVHVHFYVARDMSGELWLYLGKPERWRNRFSNFHGICGNFTANKYHFKDFGLNPDDFKDLKWEDEPVEVFINMEE